MRAVVATRTAHPGQAGMALGFVRDGEGLSAYFCEIRRYRSLGRKEERDLLARFRSGDKGALRILVESNLRFVVAVSRRYQHHGLTLTDLVGEGNLGLMLAALHFDPTRSCRFITYAVWWIRQRILLALASQGRCLSVPPGKAAVLQKVLHAQKTLEQLLHRPPTLGEVADHLSMEEGEVGRIQLMRQPALSLEAPVSADDGATFGDLLADSGTALPDTLYLEERRRKDIQSLLEVLRPREREILRLYYGFGEGCRLSLDEIGDRLGLTRERVRQLKDLALNRLRHPSRRAQLLDLV